MKNQEGQISQNSIINKAQNEMSFSLFKTDAKFMKMYKKTEKIVSAIYLLTNHFDDQEPIKWLLRKQGSKILSLIVGIRDIKDTDKEGKKRIIDLIAEVVSLFEVSHVSGMISENNFILLKNEFFNLITLINEYAQENQNAKEELEEAFFNVVEQLPKPAIDQKNYKGHYKGHLNNKGQDFEMVAEKRSFATADVSVKTDLFTKAKVSNNNFYEIKTPSDMRKTNRRNLILNIIKKQGGVMIKDLVPVIKGCSEKTIQRELSTLVSSGIIKREGERRWSVYKMA